MQILVAEDDNVSRQLLQVTLRKWGYDVNACGDGAQAWEVLQSEGAPRLAIVDWMMPGVDGIEVCRRVRSREGHPYVYLLLLSAKCQKADVISGLDAGADDYLTKPVDLRELELRLRTGKRILDLQSNLIKAQEALQVQATQDSLTGMANRRVILELLESEIERSRRLSTSLGLILADLDHFKLVNDNFGHLAGDSVLRQAAQTMRSELRPYDTVGRYGGEEFLVVTPGCDISDAARVADRLRRAIAHECIQTSAGPISITASFGVVSGLPGVPNSVDSLIHAADEALYRAKAAGRDRVQIAEFRNSCYDLAGRREGTHAVHNKTYFDTIRSSS